MLKVKKTSWHYRLWALTHEHPETVKPTNLCRYFWRLFFTITIPIVLAVLALVGIGALFVLIYNNPIPFLIVVAVIAAAIGGIFFIAWQERRSKRIRAEKRERARFEPDPEPKDPSVFREFIKAKKQKVCPLIEVVDDAKVG